MTKSCPQRIMGVSFGCAMEVVSPFYEEHTGIPERIQEGGRAHLAHGKDNDGSVLMPRHAAAIDPRGK